MAENREVSDLANGGPAGNQTPVPPLRGACIITMLQGHGARGRYRADVFILPGCRSTFELHGHRHLNEAREGLEPSVFVYGLTKSVLSPLSQRAVGSVQMCAVLGERVFSDFSPHAC